MSYEQLIRPLLFKLDPETVHGLTLQGLQTLSLLGSLNPLHYQAPADPVKVMGIDFPNRLGLAAGLDKDGTCLEGLAALGFGFLEVGTVTPLAQSGNPKPRLFRIPEASAVINRMGFNNQGADALVSAVKRQNYRGVLGINIGKNLKTAVAEANGDYCTALRKVYQYADYVTINISSPNTPGLRGLQEGDHLQQLLSALQQTRDELSQLHQKRLPLALKIAPDMPDDAFGYIADQVLAYGFDAIIATNTTASRSAVETMENGNETGGLSGAPLRARSTAVVATLAAHLQGQIPLIACGGIFNAADAREKIAAGASLVQIYTGLIYRGPQLIKEILSDFAQVRN